MVDVVNMLVSYVHVIRFYGIILCHNEDFPDCPQYLKTCSTRILLHAAQCMRKQDEMPSDAPKMAVFKASSSFLDRKSAIEDNPAERKKLQRILPHFLFNIIFCHLFRKVSLRNQK